MAKDSGYKEIVGKRTVASHIARVLFWGFNLLMILWIWGGLDATVGGDVALGAAESIGVGIGITMLVILWVVGDIILGLFYFFTKPTRQLVKK